MIKVIEEHVDEESITFDLHGKEVKLSFLDGKEIESKLFDIHFEKFVRERNARRKSS